MLPKQPASRPANATEVAAELAAIAADLPESDRRPAALADGGTVALEDELRSWVVAPNRSPSALRRRGDRHGGARRALRAGHAASAIEIAPSAARFVRERFDVTAAENGTYRVRRNG